MIKIVSQNFRRITIQNNRIKRALKETDIILGQEIVLPQNEKEKQNEINKLEKLLDITIYHSKRSKGTHIITIIKNSLKQYVTVYRELIDGRATMIQIKNDEYQHNIVNIYAPSGDIQGNRDFCRNLFETIKYIADPILVGDWNSILHDSMCNKGKNKDHRKQCKLIKHFFNGWIDIHNVIPGNLKYTYTKGSYRARLDRLYTLDTNIQSILTYEIKSVTYSDHDQIQFSVKWGNRIKWGNGTWKLNTKLLEDEEYNKRIKNDIEIYKLNKKFYEPMEGWDIFKQRVKSTSIEYSVGKMKNKKNNIEDMRKELDRVKMQVDQQENPNDQLIEQKTNIEQELEKLENNKIEGERIRAKIEKIKYDEKSTKYFFKKEKHSGQNKNITILKNEDDETIEEKHQILNEIENFYSKLYSTNGSENKQMEENLKYINKTLTKENQKEINEHFTTKEIESAIKSMNNEKSPGEDGIPKEFYNHFFDELKEILIELFNNIYFSTTLPSSHKNAIIKLLYKKNDQRYLKNWRPISLLNVDYKILSKILTKRLTKFMNEIIPIEQKCGVKERKLTDIIRNIDTFRQYANEGYIVLLDQTKAFDRVNHNYLFKVLEKVGVKGKTLKLVKEMYSNITSQVEINGILTNKIKIDRGVRQGCPFSMLLFVISTIPLINMIKNSTTIKGHITKRNNSIKIQSYADDTTILIKGPNELKEIERIFHNHSLASEAEINTDKTEIFRLGKPNRNEDEDFKSKIKTKVKILGAYFCENKVDETKENLFKPISRLQQWNNKYTEYITIVGKILRINTYIYSTIFNNAWLLDTENHYFKTLIDEIGKYLQKLKHLETYELVSKRINEGGLNLINIKSRVEAIKAKEILEAIYNIPETDNIIYEVSTYQRKLYNTQICGPKADPIPKKTMKIIKILEPKMEIVKNYKKRHKNLKTKELERLLFPQEKITNYNTIIQTKEAKLIEVNYKTKYGILPITSYVNCYLCGSHPEGIQHLMVDCAFLAPLRNQVDNWLEIIDKQKLNKDRIINMVDVSDEIENQIISRYKNIVWLIRNNSKKSGKRQDINEIIKILDNDIQFYFRHIRLKSER